MRNSTCVYVYYSELSVFHIDLAWKDACKTIQVLCCKCVCIIHCNVDAGSLMHMEGPTTYQQTLGFDSGVLSSVRNKLNKNNFYNFDGLFEAFQHYDKVTLKH